MPPRGSRAGVRGGARGGRGGTVAASTPVATSDNGDNTGATDVPSTAQEDVSASSATRRAAGSQSATPAPSTTGGPKFKPRRVRRNSGDRAQLEEQREKDLAAKIKMEEREQRDADRRARRGGRGGRGGDSSRGGMVRRTVTGHGPFSAVPADGVKYGGTSGGYSGYGRSGPGGSAFRGGQKPEGFPRYMDRRANDVRVNIDQLRDDAAPESSYGGSQKSSGSMPYSIPRVEHKNEDVKVATSAELEAEEQQSDDEETYTDLRAEMLRDEDAELSAAKDEGLWHAALVNTQDVRVKAEPGTEIEDAMDIDKIPAKPEAPPSPELKKKPKPEELDARELAKERKREKVMQDLETQFSIADTRALMEELNVSKPGDKEQGHERDGRLVSENDDLVEVDSTPGNNNKSAKASAKTAASAASAWPAEGGFIGKLNVRKSGKVELDWGGMPYELRLGTETGFLTTAIIVDDPENDAAATGMGNVYNKFVAAPILDEEEDWDPDLEEYGLTDPSGL
ncbi:DNA-directed RNA polymerase III RPC4 [Apiospora phragmitis]|uniref:DNA-directed RNA polymerase III RPC4 n=1 Tax=Apiospora phragmitis TaxID=2905665 RepID=A0ABR1SUX3_9PEZI